MKPLVLLLSFILLSACSFYTITNKTNEDLVIKKSGEDTFVLKAFSCIELSEHFLGLGGDFPFALKGEGREYSANHYEIILKEVNSTSEVASKSVILSNENTECDKKKSQEIKIDDTAKPVCGEDAAAKLAKCSSSDDSTATAKCEVEGDERKPICVNKDGKLSSTSPICEEKSLKPVCKKEETKPEEVKYYTITLRVEDTIVTIVEETVTRSLEAKDSCVKIKGGQFSSLVLLAKSVTSSANQVICTTNNKCAPGNYEISSKTSPTGDIEFEFKPVTSMNSSTACEEIQ